MLIRSAQVQSTKKNLIIMLYKHLSREERYTIPNLQGKGACNAFTVKTINRNASTVRRELKRNATRLF
ncbi:MAG: helix-turn-helix domain-containing protein [Akkermansiaceae bacterium]